MCHTCPECGSQCYCKGDFDDADLGHVPPGGCDHWKSSSCENDDYDEDEYDNSYYEDGPPPLITDDPNQLNLFNETETPCPNEKIQRRVTMHIVR